jgi:uncharacterized membrane protein
MTVNSQDLRELAVPPPHEDGAQVPPKQRTIVPGVTTLLLALAVNVMVVTDIEVPVFRAAAGFWFLIILPAYLLFTSSAWRHCGAVERLGYSVCTALLILMLAALVGNEILPLVNVQRPLDAGPVLITGDAVNLVLYALRSRYPERVRWRGGLAAVSKQELRLLAMAALCVALVVLGANRLNNGAGGQPTLIALAIIVLVVVFSLRWMAVVRESVVAIVIYLTSLSLLLSTSLRGWYITGHDIQDEYRVFQLTEAHGRWSMAYFHNAYNACLSITILPTELGQIIHVDNPYVYKLFFQLIFAICPVLVYGISRRYFSRRMSLLSVAYFIGFPTFFTDMPFLNRQEVALLFVATGVLAATNSVWSFRKRQLALTLAGVGVEVSHYSSMYFFVGVLIVSWLCRYGAGVLTRSSPTWLDVLSRRLRWAPGAGVSVTVGVIGVFVATVILWGGLITGSSGQALRTSESAIQSTSLSLQLFDDGNSVPPSIALADYRQATIRELFSAPSGTFLPASAVVNAPTPVVAQQLNALTWLGQHLSVLGIPVVAINSVSRNLVAYCEELFLAVGLIRLLIPRRQERRSIGQQLYWLSVGSVAMIGLITVIPALSADYGPLRAFQEGLIFFAPVVVIGSVTLFRPLFRRQAAVAAAVLWLGLFLNTSGLVPQLLGGNLAELNLNNSGSYYDLYYMSPQSVAAVSWLGQQPTALAYPIQATFIQSRYNFTSPNDVNGSKAIIDAYPTMIYRRGWVILGYPTVGRGLAYTFIPASDDLVEYKYPTWLLNEYKNLVYTNGSAVIYK